jgi:UDP-N-acetylmuramate dehydrogenase
MINIQENIKLAPYTTYKIGGPAKYFVEVSNKQEALEALEFVKSKNLKYFVLCGGSNVLFSDEGYDGLIIKLNLRELGIENNTIYAESGVKLMALINFGIKNELSGLEFLAGVPGEVGGAIRGNAGAFQKSISDYLKKVEVVRDGEIVEVQKEEIEFDYRDSEFKRNKDIILAGYFELEKSNIEKAKAEIEKNINYRKENHPWEPSAGSTFKNPKDKSVGEMVEELGLKGHRVGDAQISEQHGNFIVNLGEAKASDVKDLIALVKTKVKGKFGVNLEEEIMIV